MDAHDLGASNKTIRLDFFTAQDYRIGQKLSKQLLTIAERTADPQRLTVAHYLAGIIALFRGDFQDVLTHVTQGIRHYDVQRHAALVSRATVDPVIGCYIYRAEALRLLGYADQAAEQIKRLVARHLGTQMVRDLEKLLIGAMKRLVNGDNLCFHRFGPLVEGWNG
jgi:hypothetical protein